MESIGFVISAKENEKRRALLPTDVIKIKNSKMLFFESGYGEILGISDQDYEKAGAQICTRNFAFSLPIVCCTKAPVKSEQVLFPGDQTFFGWVHAVQGRAIVDFLLSKNMSCISWEEMFCNERPVFWRNREIAGEAAVLHAINYFGILPAECSVALIGRGNCARGAFRVLSQLGAKITVYDRRTVQNIRNEIGQYDIIINAVLWDVFREDHIIYRSDLKYMKPGCMIIDISCDDAMAIESSHSTTIKEPIYLLDNVIHYAVDHTPAIFYKTVTQSISAALFPYLDDLIEENPNPIIDRATSIKNGKILDERIIRFQHR